MSYYPNPTPNTQHPKLIYLQPITYKLLPITCHLQPITYKFLFLSFLVFLIYAPLSNAYIINFTPRFSITGEFTDNIYLTDEDNKESEVISTVSSGFTIALIERNAGVSFSYDPAASFYATYDENNTLRHNAQASMWSELTRNTRVDLLYAYLRTEAQSAYEVGLDEAGTIDMPVIEGSTTIRRDRYVTDTNTAGIEATHQFSSQNSMVLGYTYSTVAYEEAEAGEDTESHTPSIRFVYWPVPNKWGFEIGAAYIRGLYEGETDDFENLHGDVRITKQFKRNFSGYLQYDHIKMEYDGDTENYQIYNPTIGIDYTFSDNTNFGLGVGYFLQDREESEDEAGVTVNGNIGKTWQFRHGSIGITGGSGYDESFLDNENLGFSVYYGASILGSYTLSRKVTGDIGCSIRQDRYINPAPEEPEREDLSARVSAGATWHLASWLNARAEVSSQSVDSNVEGSDYTEKRAVISVTMTPASPFRIVR